MAIEDSTHAPTTHKFRQVGQIGKVADLNHILR